ncbi:MAG: hypothetical protein PHY93_08285 [Bacteriovorax sp.]|nr:hypothetical protein [Bacteriovorax sp.]
MTEVNRDNKNLNENEKKPSSENPQEPNSNPIENRIQHNPYIYIDNEITTSDPFFMFNTKQEL